MACAAERVGQGQEKATGMGAMRAEVIEGVLCQDSNTVLGTLLNTSLY